MMWANATSPRGTEPLSQRGARLCVGLATSLGLRLGLGLGLALGVPLALADNPPIPSGFNAHGTSLALVGSGVDYRMPDVAGCLARDGEGLLVSWDFVDDDAVPFGVTGAAPLAASVLCGPRNTPVGAAEPTAAPAKIPGRYNVNLVVARIDMSDRSSLPNAIGFVAQTPAKIVLVTDLGGDPEHAHTQRRWLHLAARQFKDRLFIAVAHRQPSAPDAARATTPPTQGRTRGHTQGQTQTLPNPSNLLVIGADQGPTPTVTPSTITVRNIAWRQPSEPTAPTPFAEAHPDVQATALVARSIARLWAERANASVDDILKQFAERVTPAPQPSQPTDTSNGAPMIGYLDQAALN